MYYSDHFCCCGKCVPTSWLSCIDNLWRESVATIICGDGGQDGTCGNQTICPWDKPDANSACEANKTKPEECHYGQ